MANTRQPKHRAASAVEPRLALPLFLAGVFIMKALVVWQLHDHPLLQPDAGIDTTAYIDLAKRALAGNWLLGPGQYFVSPLYIYFLAAAYGLTKTFTAVRLAQAALGTISVALVFLTTAQWYGRRAAWIAGVAAALTGLFTFYEALIMQAALDPILTSAALAALSLGLTRRSTRWLLLSGVVFGLQTLNRPNVAVAAGGVVLLFLALRRWRGATMLAAGLVMGLMPVLVRNAIVTGEWTLPASHGGLNFYIGNGPGATGGYHQVAGVSRSIEGQETDSKRVAEAAVGHPLTDSGVSSYFTTQTLAWMTSHPGESLALMLKKIGFTLNAAHISLDFSYPFFAYDAGSLLRFLFVQPWLLVPLGFAGLIWAAPQQQRQDYWLFASFAPLYVLSVALFFVSDRYRLPLFVPLSAGAGALIDRGISAFNARRARALLPAGATVAALALVSLWPFGLDDGRGEQRMMMAGHAIMSGQYDEGERWTSLALAVHPQPSVVQFRVGGWYLKANRAPQALPHLTEANRLDPQQPPVEFALGQALLGSGHSGDAVPMLRAGSTPSTDENRFAHLDLARALEDTGHPADALLELQLMRPLPSDDADVWLRMGRLAAEAQAPAIAEPYFRRAVELKPDLATAREQYGLTLVVLNRFEDGAREFGHAIQLNPRSADAHAYLAFCDAKLGRAADARTQAEEALRLDPSSSLATQVLAALGIR